MTELEQYIRSHADEFDTREPAEGHEARFLSRLEQAQKPSWKPLRVVWGTIALAASLAALFLMTRSLETDPEAIYLAYMEQVSALYSACPPDAGAEWDEAIASVTDEPVPLFQQLPEEMPAREKARILKRHYASLLSVAKHLANQ